MLQEDTSVSLLTKVIEDSIIFKKGRAVCAQHVNHSGWVFQQFQFILCMTSGYHLVCSPTKCGWRCRLDSGTIPKNISVAVCGKLISLHWTNNIEVVIMMSMNICLDSKVKLWPEFNLLLPWFFYYVCYNYCVSSSLLCRSFIPFSYIYPSLVIISDDKTF